MLATHATRPPLDIPASLARAVTDGDVDNWEALGAANEPLRVVDGANAIAQVEEDPGALAVVPAWTVGPTVRAVRVDGHHPLREPEAYPLHSDGRQPAQVVTVSVVGDVMLGRGVGDAIESSGDWAAPMRATAQRLSAADVTIGTFEATLSRLGEPTQGSDSFSANPAALEGPELAGFDVWSLANNHVWDFGDESLVDTVQQLRDAGFETFGAGADQATAAAPAVVEVDGVRVGVLGFNAIGETPRAGPNQPGTVRMDMQPRTGPLSEEDLERMRSAIADLRDDVDVLLFMPHWGEQYTHEPVDDQRRVGRELLEAGADIVVGGHPHWVQGVEMHEGRLLVHSLGNFVFDMDWEPQVQQGVVLELTFWIPGDDQPNDQPSELMAAEFVPYEIGDDFTPRFVSAQPGEPGAQILSDIWSASGTAFDAGS